jgi:hypothetical protein
VTFDADNTASSHVDTITREIQMAFKRLDGEIRSMDQGTNRDEDAQVSSSKCGRRCRVRIG